MWQLVVLTTEAERLEYILEPGQILLGRRDDCDIRIADLSASRVHAEVEFDAVLNRVTLKDMNSNNGTYINGKMITDPVILQHEDSIRIGMHLITILHYPDSQSAYISEKELERITKPNRGRITPPTGAPTRPVRQDLIESVENYGMLFNSMNEQLVTLTNVDDVLYESTQFLIRLTNADGGKGIQQKNFDRMHEFGIPKELGERVIQDQSASLVADTSNVALEPEFAAYHSMLLVPVFNSSEIIGLIFIYKTRKHMPPFTRRDMQISVAASHQIELAIQQTSFNETLLHTATHDALTKLPNRKLLLERAQQLIGRQQDTDKNLFALFFMDINNFKVLNDSLGHSSGDLILIDFGKRIQEHFPTAFLIARYAGDEFAMLMSELETETAVQQVADELLTILQQPFTVHGQETFLSVSIGVATSNTKYSEANDMIRDADIAMYHAKETSQVDIKIFDKELHDQLMEMMLIQNDLRSGEIEKEFEVYYQPIMDAKTSCLAGFEALIRWNSPERGLVMPNDFMSTANTTGALNLIDLWAMHAAAAQLAEWHKAYPQHKNVYVSVNITPKMFNSVDLVQEIEMALADTGLAPHHLRIEITERASLGNQNHILETLKRLKALGVFVGLDDFGTGYSSLSHLQRLPLRFLKIDRTFVMNLGKDEESAKIVQLVLALANSLDLLVVAEGVETQEHLEYLQNAGCDFIQGFLISKAIVPAEAIAFLEKETLL